MTTFPLFRRCRRSPGAGRGTRERPYERRPLRAALLAAAIALAVSGASTGAALLPSSARAEAQPAQSVAPASGPASFADIVDRVRGAVVAIKVKTVETAPPEAFGLPDLSPDDPLYRFFKRFGEEGRRLKRFALAQGSGFIISADGNVVTNHHVVEHATEVEVSLDNGQVLPAKVVGTDKRTDLALLKINDGNNLPHVDWSSARPRVGDWVIAVGNPFGLGGTVTAGIVSARGRDIGAGTYDDFIQIDAPVNRGNSGGPTFDTHGAVIGVNTAIYSPSGGSVGIGFAIPAEVAKDVIKALEEHGVVARGWIGVRIQPVTQDIADSLGLKSTKGALVAQPQHGSPAETAGLKAGDVITAVDGEKVEGPRDLARKIAAMGPGKTVDLTYIRSGSEKSVKLRLGTLPEEKEAAAESEDSEKSSSLSSFGLAVEPATAAPGVGGEGLVVVSIDPTGPAAEKGLRRGDVILEAGGHALKTESDLAAAIEAAKKDGRKSVLLRVKSGEGTRFVALAVNPS